MRAYIHPCIHTYIYTYIHTYLLAYLHTDVLTCIRADVHTYVRLNIRPTYIRTYMCTYMCTYIQTYIHIYTCECTIAFACVCPPVKHHRVHVSSNPNAAAKTASATAIATNSTRGISTFTTTIGPAELFLQLRWQLIFTFIMTSFTVTIAACDFPARACAPLRRSKNTERNLLKSWGLVGSCEL